MVASKRKLRKVRRFKQVVFKLTTQQKKRVDAFCKNNATTPVNMYKKAILLYLNNSGYNNPKHHPPTISENQMSIFDFVEDPLKQETGA